MFRPALFAAVAAFVLAVACSSSASESVETVNASCPVMGGAVEPDGGTVEWNGHTVGFCCAGCSEDFAAMSEAEKLAKLTEGGADLSAAAGK